MKKIAIFLTALFAVSLLSGCISAPPGLERDKSAIQDLKRKIMIVGVKKCD